MVLHGLSCSPRALSTALSAFSHSCLIGSMAPSAFLSCTSSRGVMRPTATLEMSRSISPISSSCSFTSSRPSRSLKKYSTTSRRLLICFTSLSGNNIQRRSKRAPIGDIVRSITDSRLLPSSHIGSISSRLRTVKRSSRT